MFNNILEMFFHFKHGVYRETFHTDFFNSQNKSQISLSLPSNDDQLAMMWNKCHSICLWIWFPSLLVKVILPLLSIHYTVSFAFHTISHASCAWVPSIIVLLSESICEFDCVLYFHLSTIAFYNPSTCHR